MTSAAFCNDPAAILRLLLVGFVAASCSPSEPSPPSHPDVVLFVIDTLRRDRLGSYGYPRPTSPNLDRLVSEGTIFEDATAQSSWTMPSMVSMLQGHYVTDYRDVFQPEHTTLAEVFHRAGYRTIGVCGNTLLAPEADYGRGFDHYDAHGPAKEDLGADPTARSAEILFRDLGVALEHAEAASPRGERQPLFIYAHLMDPHYPYHPHPEFDAELPLDGSPPILERLREVVAREGAPPPPEDAGWASTWKRLERARGCYDQEVRFVDREISLFLDRLRAQGVRDHALVALVADHGEGLFEHVSLATPEQLATLPPGQFLQREHGKVLYESLVGTPFLLWGAGVPKGLRVQQPVENVDLFPTLVELAGLDAPPGLHGRSLVGILQGLESPPREEVRSFVRQNVMVREVASGLKLTLPSEFGASRGAVPTLFSLGDDPEEIRNLHDERPEDVERLRGRIAAWLERYPTASSLYRRRKSKEMLDLQKLGYTGEHEDEAEKK